DLRPRAGIKRLRVIQEKAAVQRNEARIQVVEARIGEVQRAHRDVPCIGNVRMRRSAGTNAVGCPQNLALIVEGAVALSLEGRLAGRLPQEEALAEEPLAKEYRLCAPLPWTEAGERGDAMVDLRSV